MFEQASGDTSSGDQLPESSTSLFDENYKRQDSFHQDSNGNSPVKRQKIDQDGFVTPATPDIPRLSDRFNPYAMQGRGDSAGFIDGTLPASGDGSVPFTSYHMDGLSQDDQITHFPNESADEVDDIHGLPQREQGDDINNADLSYGHGDDPSSLLDEHNAVDHEGLEAGGGDHQTSHREKDSPCTVISITDEEDETCLDIRTDLGELVKSMGEESQKFQNACSDSFAESKNFEMFLPARLDKILHEALEFEQHLIQQKEQLKQRLGLLGQTLQPE